MIKLIYTFTLVIFLIASGSGQNTPKQNKSIINLSKAAPDIVLNHLTEKDGLSYNMVTGIVDDNEGMLWISTPFGLNRYDGHRFDVFKRNKNDTTSIIQNYILSICRDSCSAKVCAKTLAVLMYLPSPNFSASAISIFLLLQLSTSTLELLLTISIVAVPFLLFTTPERTE